MDEKDERQAESLPDLNQSSSENREKEKSDFRVAQVEAGSHPVRREDEGAGVLAEVEVRAQEAGDVPENLTRFFHISVFLE